MLQVVQHEWEKACSYEKVFYIAFLCCVLLMTCKYIQKVFVKEGMRNPSPNQKHFQQKFTLHKSFPDIYNSFYVSIYDKIFFDPYRYQFEMKSILKHTKIDEKSVVLDIGCGTGHTVRGIHPYTKNVQGIDLSREMIKKAKTKYPYLKFHQGDAMHNLTYESNTFTHILALYFSIYMFKDKYGILNNVYSWLRPKGYFIVHLVNRKMFDPVVAPANPLAFVSIQKYAKERITKSTVKFNDFTYDSHFSLDDKNDTALFEETLKHDINGNVIKNTHTIHAPKVNDFLKLAQTVGFKVIEKIDMTECEYEYQYLYILQKQ